MNFSTTEKWPHSLTVLKKKLVVPKKEKRAVRNELVQINTLLFIESPARTHCIAKEPSSTLRNNLYGKRI